LQIKSEIANQVMDQIKTAPWQYIGTQFDIIDSVHAHNHLWQPVQRDLGWEQLQSQIPDQITTDTGELFNV
jgi:hypothetical protein